jgi:hypothetical protein
MNNNQRIFTGANKMANSVKELDCCTKEQLEELLAALLAQARGQTLNDAEVQEFWRVYQEIQRRSRPAA